MMTQTIPNPIASAVGGRPRPRCEGFDALLNQITQLAAIDGRR